MGLMKKIILSLMVAGFAIAVQAGDAKTCPNSKTADTAGCCCHKTKTSLQVKTSQEAKGTCPFAKSACTKQTAAKKTNVKQTVLLSPKAADLVQ